MFALFIALMLMLIAASPVQPAQAVELECQTATESEFLGNVKRLNPVVHEVSPRALAAFLKQANEARAKNKIWLLEADTMLVGIFKRQGKSSYTAGTVMFKDDCMVPGSDTEQGYFDFLKNLKSLGLSIGDLVRRVDSR